MSKRKKRAKKNKKATYQLLLFVTFPPRFRALEPWPQQELLPRPQHFFHVRNRPQQNLALSGHAGRVRICVRVQEALEDGVRELGQDLAGDVDQVVPDVSKRVELGAVPMSRREGVQSDHLRKPAGRSVGPSEQETRTMGWTANVSCGWRVNRRDSVHL